MFCQVPIDDDQQLDIVPVDTDAFQFTVVPPVSIDSQESSEQGEEYDVDQKTPPDCFVLSSGETEASEPQPKRVKMEEQGEE